MPRGYTTIPSDNQSPEDVSQSLLSKTVKIISDIFEIQAIRSLQKDAKLLIFGKVVRMYSFGFLAVMVSVTSVKHLLFAFAVGNVTEFLSLTCMHQFVVGTLPGADEVHSGRCGYDVHPHTVGGCCYLNTHDKV